MEFKPGELVCGECKLIPKTRRVKTKTRKHKSGYKMRKVIDFYQVTWTFTRGENE